MRREAKSFEVHLVVAGLQEAGGRLHLPEEKAEEVQFMNDLVDEDTPARHISLGPPALGVVFGPPGFVGDDDTVEGAAVSLAPEDLLGPPDRGVVAFLIDDGQPASPLLSEVGQPHSALWGEGQGLFDQGVHPALEGRLDQGLVQMVSAGDGQGVRTFSVQEACEIGVRPDAVTLGHPAGPLLTAAVEGDGPGPPAALQGPQMDLCDRPPSR